MKHFFVVVDYVNHITTRYTHNYTKQGGTSLFVICLMDVIIIRLRYELNRSKYLNVVDYIESVYEWIAY